MKIMRTLMAGALASAMMLGAPLALAHAKLTESNPPAGARVVDVPPQLTLHFSAPLRLTYVALAPSSREAIKLTPPTGQTSATHVLPLPALVPDEYTVEWRAMSADGHVMKGTWQFQVARD